ncbi:MAG: hypothetical protein QOH25_2949 [Acidobacteriota bacterium]|nr:hypothetical protein [Acidobacteriota bacterium]
MKRCPSCQQTYPDDAPDYCSNDGMRLVDEESATFDPEKTVMASGLRGGEPASPSPPAPPPPPPQQYQVPNAPPDIKPPTQWQPQGEPPPAQPWNAPGGQHAQPGWPPPPPPAQNWGGAPFQQPAANAPYAAGYAPLQGGRSRALSIAALVTGACAVTIMSLLVVRGSRNFVLSSMLVLAILGIGLGVASLILSLQKPTRFGGVPLAIAGLATGTAALVYYFTL